MKKMLFVLVLALLVMPCTFLAQDKAAAAAAPEGTQVQSAAPERSMSPERMQRREDRMKRHDEMVAKKKEMDARLDEKVAAMDAAKGDQKVEAIAAVIKEMVAQRKSMQEQMMKRHHGMKGKHGRMGRGMEGKEGSGERM
ncbi:MAG: hypothetical protein AB9866_17800 [Syntrophobacteraceae bacterium]